MDKMKHGINNFDELLVNYLITEREVRVNTDNIAYTIVQLDKLYDMIKKLMKGGKKNGRRKSNR